MNKLLLLSFILVSTSAFAKERLQCDFTRTDGKIESIMMNLKQEGGSLNEGVAAKYFNPLDEGMYIETAEIGSSQLGAFRVDYSFARGPVECDECRTGSTRTEKEHLLISKNGKKVEILESIYTMFNGNTDQLNSTPGYNAVICFEPK